MGLLKTLLKPDHDENPDRSMIAHAANLLQIGEFQFLQLAYAEWYGDEMRASDTDRAFSEYMLNGRIPAYVRSFARKIIAEYDANAIDPNDPKYHRYDVDYHTSVPNGMRQFVTVSMTIAILVFGVILVTELSVRSNSESASLFPPYFDKKEISDSAVEGNVKN